MAASSFDTAFADAQTAIYNQFGVSATYNGSSVTVCLEDYDTAVEQYPEVQSKAAVIDIRASDVPAPATGATVVMDSVTYQVSDILRRDNLGATLALSQKMVRP